MNLLDLLRSSGLNPIVIDEHTVFPGMEPPVEPPKESPQLSESSQSKKD